MTFYISMLLRWGASNRGANGPAGEVRCETILRTASPVRPYPDRSSSRESLAELFAQICETHGIRKAAIARCWGVDESYVRQVMSGSRAWTAEKLDTLPVDLFDALSTEWRRRRGLDVATPATDPCELLLAMTAELGGCAAASTRLSWDNVAVHAGALRRLAARLEAFALSRSGPTTPPLLEAL